MTLPAVSGKGKEGTVRRRTAFGVVVAIAGFLMLGSVCNTEEETGIHPTTHVGWAVAEQSDGYGAILKTEDGGATWVRQGDSLTIPDVALERISAADEQSVWTAGDSNSGHAVILHTTDGGTTWVRQGDSTALADMRLGAVTAVDAQTAWVAGRCGVILKTEDGGATWVGQAESMWPDYGFTDAHAVDRQHVWLAGNPESGVGGFLVVRTTDGGTSWERQGEADLPDSANVIGIHAPNNSTVWVVGSDNMCCLSTDGGESWSLKLELAPHGSGGHNNQIVALDDQRAWIARDYSGAWFTPNAGDSWILCTTPAAGSYPVNLGVTATHHDTVWMTSSSATAGNIVRTLDGGDNWVEVFRTDSAGLGGTRGLRGISFVGARR